MNLHGVSGHVIETSVVVVDLLESKEVQKYLYLTNQIDSLYLLQLYSKMI